MHDAVRAATGASRIVAWMPTAGQFGARAVTAGPAKTQKGRMVPEKERYRAADSNRSDCLLRRITQIGAR